MSQTWSTLRNNIRVNLLADTPDEDTGEFRWTDEELLIACAWALDTFADHTAQATATSFPVSTETDEYELPDNILDDEPVDVTLTVFSEMSDGTRVYLDPIAYSSVLGVGLNNGVGFYLTPDQRLKITKDLGSAETLHVWYFAYYNAPAADSDLIVVPRWAVPAVSYLIAAHVLSGDSLKTANIRQYNQKPDTGQPEHNPLAQQQARYLKMYEQEIARHDPQLRVNNARYQEQ